MKFIILGCGSSMGVPRADGFFGKCNPQNPKNYRTRCSAIIKSVDENILIDTSPDLRKQLIDNKIKKIDRVIFTHSHADQTHGINDLRVFFLNKKKKLPVYVDSYTKKYLLNTFSYCFRDVNYYPATLKLLGIKKKLFFGESIEINPIEVRHGLINSLSFIINKKLAYLPDVNQIFKKDFKKFKNLEYIIIDCLRYKKHPSHFNLKDVMGIYEKLEPKKMILTNLHSDLDYDELMNILPKNIKPAYDGLSINF